MGAYVEGSPTPRRLTTVESSCQSVCTVDAETVARCDMGGPENVVTYDVTLTYVPAGQVLELYSLMDYLNGYADTSAGQEPLTEQIYADIEAALVPVWLGVDLHATHAPGVALTTERQTDTDSHRP